MTSSFLFLPFSPLSLNNDEILYNHCAVGTPEIIYHKQFSYQFWIVLKCDNVVARVFASFITTYTMCITHTIEYTNEHFIAIAPYFPTYKATVYSHLKNVCKINMWKWINDARNICITAWTIYFLLLFSF